MPRTCTHLDQIRDVSPRTQGCEACAVEGTTWIELRLCLTCGHVGCCEESPGRHARRHFEETGHPIIRSLEPGDDWTWCYADDVYVSGAYRPRDSRRGR